MKSRKSSGFTLIELLIVVAIIAILAAIAVPNFLEAQVRAKVSRDKADMRSIATALESYAVDNTRYPPGYSYFYPAAVPNDYQGLGLQPYLTTPIAYITSIPKDPFLASGRIMSAGTLNTTDKCWQYQSLDWPGGDFSRISPGGSGIWVKAGFVNLYGKDYKWVLAGIGPTRNPTPQVITTGADDINVLNYDPSNGTISAGHIVLSNKGFLTTAGLQ